MSLPRGWLRYELLQLIYLLESSLFIGCSPLIPPKHWYNPSSLTFTLSCFRLILNVLVSLYCSWTFLIMSFICFKSLLVANGPFNTCFLGLPRKQLFQLNTLDVLRSENFDNSVSNMFSVVHAVARTLIFFFSILDSSQF